MSNLTPTTVPTHTEGGAVDYIVPPGQYILDQHDAVWAEPGDHIHGYRLPTGIQLSVNDAIGCPCNEFADDEIHKAH